MSWHCGSIGVSDVPLMTSVYYENLTIAHSIAAASAAVTSVVALAVYRGRMTFNHAHVTDVPTVAKPRHTKK